MGNYMSDLIPVGVLLLGVALGVGATVLVMRGRLQRARGEGRAAAETEIAVLNERVAAHERTIKGLESDLRQRDKDKQDLQQKATDLKTREAQLQTTLDKERKAAAEKLGLLDEARQKLTDAFKALAAECLKTNNSSFLELARTSLEKFHETAKGDLDLRQQAITELVKPVKDTLEKVDTKMQEIEKARAEAYGGLVEQVKGLAEMGKDLRGETASLVQALRRPTVRGRWGEIQLKRVVEMAGMLDHCDFYEQQSVESETGQLRPDLLVRLPGEKNVVVDAKTPLSGFLDALEAPDDTSRLAKLKDHARHVRAHMTNLSKKSYFEQFSPSPEFVVLFLPGESFFSAALEHDPELIEFGAAHNVIIATPTTLIALLRAVAYGWRQERLAQNAREISELGRELHKRLSSMGDHFAQMGKSLEQTIDAYNKAVGSLESRVLVSARRFRDLDAAGLDGQIDELSPVERTPRQLQAQELVQPTPNAVGIVAAGTDLPSTAS